MPHDVSGATASGGGPACCSWLEAQSASPSLRSPCASSCPLRRWPGWGSSWCSRSSAYSYYCAADRRSHSGTTVALARQLAILHEATHLLQLPLHTVEQVVIGDHPTVRCRLVRRAHDDVADVAARQLEAVRQRRQVDI